MSKESEQEAGIGFNMAAGNGNTLQSRIRNYCIHKIHSVRHRYDDNCGGGGFHGHSMKTCIPLQYVNLFKKIKLLKIFHAV